MKVKEKDGETEFVGDEPKNEDVQNIEVRDENDDGESKD